MNTEIKIPGLYETEKIPFDEKIIHEVYYFIGGFIWLIAEYDPETKEAFILNNFFKYNTLIS